MLPYPLKNSGIFNPVDNKLNGEDVFVAHGSETSWPNGITDPETLVSKAVVVGTNDVTSEADTIDLE